ncbi:MAG: DUF4405 domain-containing protein [Bacteroidales bacterium]|jgi:hypothetical protein|nr:DUF4405 domain-containing protein [Bacteroidales bacterium]
MRTNLYFLTLITLLFLGVASFGQCPKGKTICYGECGLFTDENGDNLCDIPSQGKVENKEEQSIEEDSIIIKEKVEIKKTIPQKEKTKEEKQNSIEEDSGIVLIDGQIAIEAQVDEIKNINDTNSKKSNALVEKPILKNKRKPYNLLSITISTLFAYFFTLLLSKKKIIRKITHRKIWNSLLLISFLVSCLLGFLLVLQINYRILPQLYMTNLKLHVDFGIAMTLIAIIHILWHISYFKKLFKTKKDV